MLLKYKIEKDAEDLEDLQTAIDYKYPAVDGCIHRACQDLGYEEIEDNVYVKDLKNNIITLNIDTAAEIDIDSILELAEAILELLLLEFVEDYVDFTYIDGEK